MLFSVIIPTCHRNDLLAKCLDCLIPGKQSLDPRNYEVIVTDDGVRTTARELVAADYPWAKWVAGPRLGPAANRNRGAKCALGKWLVFTDDDCLPAPGFLAAYHRPALAGTHPVLEGKTLSTGLRARVDMECPENELGGYLWSCNVAVHRDFFHEMNGFDTGFPGPAMEDVDFRTRLVKAGKHFKFVPDAVVLHPWRLKKGFAFLNIYARSWAFFIGKHPEAAEFVAAPRVLLDLARTLVKRVPAAAVRCRGRGLFRELVLLAYSSYAVVKYSRGALRRRDNAK